MKTKFTYALAIVAVAGMLSSCDGNGKNDKVDSMHVDSSVNVKTDTTAVVDTSSKDTITTADSSKLLIPKNDTVGKVITKETTVKKKVTKTDN
jgi:hypothetical protein